MNTTTSPTRVNTLIINDFTCYRATIRTVGLPAVSTIKKHLRRAKATDCESTTRIICDDVYMDLTDIGRGLELMPNGQYAGLAKNQAAY